jgi:hypothetical protein
MRASEHHRQLVKQNFTSSKEIDQVTFSEYVRYVYAGDLSSVK